MNISLAIILGLTGAISWGAADFAARFRVPPSRRVPHSVLHAILRLPRAHRVPEIHRRFFAWHRPRLAALGHGRSRGPAQYAGVARALPFLRTWHVEHRWPSLLQLSGVNRRALAPQWRTHPCSARRRTRRHAARRNPSRHFLRASKRHAAAQRIPAHAAAATPNISARIYQPALVGPFAPR